MKKTIPLLIITVLSLSLGTGRAAAGDEAWAALGGFVGGVITTKIFDHHHHRDTRTEVVVVERDRYPKHKKHYKHSHRKHGCDRHGYNCERPVRYKTIRSREWVPGYWEITYDRCGTRIRVWQPGYYKQVTKRVRIEVCDDDHRGYACNGRRGYGRRY